MSGRKKDAPEPIQSSETLGLMVRQVRDGLLRHFSRDIAANGYDVNHSQFMVIKILGTEGDKTATELANAIDHDPGAMTRLLDRLVAKGYIRRTPMAHDRRAVQIGLTASGREMMVVCLASGERISDYAMRDLKAEERHTLIALLKRVRASLEESP